MADILTPTLSAIENMRSEASDALGRLEDATRVPYLSWFDFAAIEGFAPAEPNKISTTARDIPHLEKVPTPTLDKLTLDRYNQHVWQGTNLNALQTKIMDWIDTGGVGISQEVQDAIFGQGRERNLQALRDRLDLAGVRTGAKGFRYANSMTRVLQNQALQEYDNKQSDLSREIVRTMAELAQKNVQFAFQEDVAIETLHADFAVKYAKVFQDNNTQILERFRVEQDARIAEFEGTVKALQLEVEIQLKNAGLDSDHQERLLKTWQSDLTAHIERGKAQIAQAETNSQLRMAAIETLAMVYMDSIKGLTGSAISVTTAKIAAGK